MKKVYPAQPYRPGAMESLGNARYMLIRQHQFPDTYSEDENHVSADHDRLMSWDYKHTSTCFKKYTGTGELGLESWLHKVSDDVVMKFLIDILKVDTSIQWTGYRIMGTVHRGNGYPVWTLELFAKNPKSKTLVYTEQNVSNIIM